MNTETYFDTNKSEINELRSRLQDRQVQKDKVKYRNVVQKVIAFMTLGIDVSTLFRDMIMASATNDLVQKKLVYLYICFHAESNSDLALLTVNTLQKDAADENAMVRGLALRSMLSLRIPSLVEYMKQPLLNGLNDRSAYVRKTAVLGTLKLYYMCPDVVQDLEIVPKLYGMIRDNDSQVAMNSVLALDEMEALKGGIRLEKGLACYLIDRLKGFNEWSQCMIMDILTRYEPKEDKEFFDFMNAIDDRLNHSNKAVVMATAKLFLLYAKCQESIADDIYARLRGPLLTLLSSQSPEMVFNGLNHIYIIVQSKASLFSRDYKSFFARQSEPTYVKQKKLEVLTYIVTKKNMEEIIEEVREYVNDPDIIIASNAVESIGMIAARHPFSLDVCIKTLVGMISLEVDYITSNVVEQMGRLLLQYNDLFLTVIPHIEQCFEAVADHSKGKAAMILILGQYGEYIPSSPYFLEEIVDAIAEEESATVKSHLLTAMMKLYFKRGPECQRTLIRLLTYAIENETNMDVRDRALFYFRLLKYDINVAKNVILNDHVKSEGETKETLEPKEFKCSEFNTLSTIYGIPPEQFISACAPYKMEWPSTLSDVNEESDLPVSVRKATQLKEKPSTPSPPTVAVANLLGDLSLSELTSPAQQLSLAKSCRLTPGEYEKAWVEIKSQVRFNRSLTVVPENEEMATVMKLHNIFTMASSPPSSKVAKFFYFCCETSSDQKILVELNIYKDQGKMDGTIKCANEDLLQPFCDMFQDIFVGKWIART